ncbi:MAG: ECF transporter S component [Rikenellaceae bacterium]|nr:ECF transporter S component [Rikenellaceae bacterium]
MRTQTQALPLSLTSHKTYLWAALFVAGNIALPQLCHTVGLGGQAFLPILFFTLIAAARYGVVCGLVTAVASPLVNHLMFGMPDAGMLALTVAKSVALALVIGLAVQKTGKLTLTAGVAGIAAYQIVGIALVAATTGTLATAWSAALLSWPAMAIQVIAILVLLQLPNRK